MIDIEGLCREMRLDLLKTGYECGQSAHLGGALSMIEIMAVLFGKILKHDAGNPHWYDRDIFILSKGHGVLGYFVTLKAFGYISEEKLSTFQSNGSDLIAHPVKNIDLGIESSNGSLGQGLSFGLGIALGMKKRQQSRKVYVFLGDGECNEGSVWESASLAAETSASNLVAIVDNNGFRNDGPNGTSDRMAKVWEAFGWRVLVVDGHSLDQLSTALETAKNATGAPTVVIANTTKGKGISFMEGNNDWHHNRITQKIYEQALSEMGVA
jgi:transketolase